MKNLIFIGTASFLLISGLSACVKDQSNTDTTANAAIVPANQNINDTNYQQMIRNQTARIQSEVASHPHVGGRR